MDKEIVLFKEYIKLYDSGVYVFLNKEKNMFYLGKGTPLIARIKYHLRYNSIEKVKNLVEDRGTELYIFPIRNIYDFNEEYDHELLLIEYASYVYLIENGYESANNPTRFSLTTKSMYLKEKSRLNIKELLKFDINIFQNRFRSFLDDMHTVNTIKCKNKYLNLNLQILKEQNYDLVQEIKKIDIQYIDFIKDLLKSNINRIIELYFSSYNKLIKFEIYPDCKYREYDDLNEVLIYFIELLNGISEFNEYKSLDLKKIMKIFINLGSAYGFLESTIDENYYEEKLPISSKYLEDMGFIMGMINYNIKQLNKFKISIVE